MKLVCFFLLIFSNCTYGLALTDLDKSLTKNGFNSNVKDLSTDPYYSANLAHA